MPTPELIEELVSRQNKLTKYERKGKEKKIRKFAIRVAETRSVRLCGVGEIQ